MEKLSKIKLWFRNGFISCKDHPVEYFDVTKADPKNFSNYPSCYIAKIPFAGKPLTKDSPLNLFS